MPTHKPPIENADLLLQRVELNTQGNKARSNKTRDAIVLVIVDDGYKFVHALATERRDDAELGQMRSESVEAPTVRAPSDGMMRRPRCQPSMA